MTDSFHQEITDCLTESYQVKKGMSETMVNGIQRAIEVIISTYKTGGKVVLFGNGGSAADAQHIAGELVGRFKIERQPLPAIALTANTSILTALANDYGYQYSFSRQVEALVNRGDVAIGISTSGNSPNVIEAMKAARAKGASTIGLTGAEGRGMAEVSDIILPVPSNNTPRIQEAHITIGHVICQIVEREISAKSHMLSGTTSE